MLRLEAFKEKKTAEKKQLEEASTSHQQTLENQVAGTTSSTDNRLILKLDKVDDKTQSSPLSPILQVDGAAEQEKAKYSFVSRRRTLCTPLKKSSQELKLNVLWNPEKELHHLVLTIYAF